MPANARFRKGFLLALVVGITAAFFFVIRDFVMTLLFAAIFSGLAQPLYRRLLALVGGRRAMASFLTLALVVLVVAGPLIAVFTVVANEALRFANEIAPRVAEMMQDPEQLRPYLSRVPGASWLIPYQDDLAARAVEAAGELGRVVVSTVSDTTRSTLTTIIDFFMMLYAMFFFLMDRRYLDSMLRYLPLQESEEDQMLERFVSVTRATLKGTLFIGVIQGALGGVIFAVLGIPGAVLWGLLMIVLSVLPVVGGALVWVPAAIVLAVEGEWLRAIVLVLFSSLVIGAIDNLLRPRLVGHDTKMSDLLVLFSTLGGIAGFGPLGFIVGPIIAALFVTVWEIFGKAYHRDLDVESPA
jgi:predicted PurR-regulated permease PerM